MVYVAAVFFLVPGPRQLGESERKLALGGGAVTDIVTDYFRNREAT